MNQIRRIAELNARELEAGTPPSGSWHTDYRDTAYIYVGGLPYELSEGDIVTIFSQFGEPVFINLVRDKETGKSKGFCFLKYEDQRSADLAVDNLSGASVMGKMLSVDHNRYKRKEGEDLGDNTYGDVAVNGAGEGTEGESESEEEDARRPMLREERELAALMRDHDEEDPMKAYLIEQKQTEVAVALKALQVKDAKKSSHRSSRHRERRHRDRDRDREGDRDRDREDRHRRRRHEERKSRSKDRHRKRRSPSDSPSDEKESRSRR